jgi:hypothetical protein
VPDNGGIISTPKRLTAAAKRAQAARKRTRSLWWKIPLAIVLAAFIGVVTFESVRSAIASEAFYLSGKGGVPQYADDAKVLFDAAVSAGVVPFSADAVLHLQLPLPMIALVAFGYGLTMGARGRRRAAIFASVAFAISVVSLGSQIGWLSTGVPYSNYLENTSPWRYTWTILALSICSAGWGLVAYLCWRPGRFSFVLSRLRPKK